MRNFKFFTMIFAIMATLCFTACENDNDKKQETNTCEPSACEMVENATEMGCDDSGHCVVKACADTFKVAEDTKSCEAEALACTCDPTCKEGEDCVKGDDGACGCRAKDKPAVCDPACEDGKTKCECTNDTCSCVPVTDKCDPLGSPACSTECKEGEGCICQDDEWKCVPKNDNPTDKCLCDDDTDCPDGDKDKCPKEPTQPTPVK